jgi:GntR family transcriptional regulator
MKNAPFPFRLDTACGVPFYRQVIDQVLLAVADGRLTPGTQLPTVRQLAVDLSVNLNTVAKAYREMEIRGIVQTQQGTGTFVAERARPGGAAERKRALERLVDELLAKAGSQGFDVDEVADAVAARTAGPKRR